MAFHINTNSNRIEANSSMRSSNSLLGIVLSLQFPRFQFSLTVLIPEWPPIPVMLLILRQLSSWLCLPAQPHLFGYFCVLGGCRFYVIQRQLCKILIWVPLALAFVINRDFLNDWWQDSKLQNALNRLRSHDRTIFEYAFHDCYAFQSAWGLFWTIPALRRIAIS